MLTEKLKEYRKKRGLTLEEVAHLIGTSRQTVHRYETGVIANVPPEKVEALAAALGVTPAHLMGWSDTAPNTPETLPHDFSVSMCGDALIASRVRDGDLVYVRSADAYRDGEIVCVSLDGQTILRRLFLADGDTLILTSDTPDYPPLVFAGQERARVRILGKAVAFFAPLP